MKRKVVDMTEAEIMVKLSDAILKAGMTIVAAGDQTGIGTDRLAACLSGAEEMVASEYLALCQLLKLDPYYAE